ncbi:MAG: medium-chain fatty-acid--CoA ligase [Eggerthellales bacterium]|nr:medium-chain fatty-acid--CoA ligase [Eggerthellales bacterium]
MITDLKINPENKRRWYEEGWWTEDTLYDVWHRTATTYPDREYVCDSTGTRLTYGEIDEKSSRLAAWLKERGIKNGDVVSFQIPIWSEFAYVYVAVLKVGAVMHPLPVNFNEEDLVYSMNLVESKALICPTFYHKTDYEAQALAVMKRVPTMQSIALIDKVRPATCDWPTIAQIFADYEPLTEAPESKSDDVANILSTSGTTGFPKAVLFTHNNILASERTYIDGAERTDKDVMIMMSPLNHATGFYHGLISNMIMGARVVLQERFSPEQAVQLINDEGATWSHGATPFVYDTLNYLEETGKSIPSMDIFISGGAPLPGSMVERCARHGFKLCESYGSTESCPHVYVPPAKALEWDGERAGIPCDGVEVRIVDADHNEVPRGVKGEEASRGPNVFVGYYKNEKANAECLDDEGWFYSGDLSFMDEEGRIKICGRIKEIIIRGGENISVNEIDANLEGCPGMGAHATCGMPDDRLGERICTFAVPVEGEPFPTVKDVQEYLASKNVQKRLWPERIEQIDALPYTLSGKVKRYELAAEIKRRMGLA